MNEPTENMNETSVEKTTEYVYKAFISYRHKPIDKEVAQKIHFALEHYKIPNELRKKGVSNRLGKVFRDEEELPATGNLSESINYALENSEFLIVVCTPDTPESIWVREEITRFKELHGYDHVIAVLADGTPDDSFPEELITVDDPDHPGQTKLIEPLAANLTDMNSKYDKSRFKREVVRLYAAILGCPYDTLWQREHRYKLRKYMLIAGAVSAVFLAFAISMLVKNREISQRNQMIEEQNAEIIKRNEEIEAQNSELTLKEASALIREAELHVDNGDNEKAIQAVLEALSSKEGAEEYSDDAELLLSNALGAGLFKDAMRRYSSVTLDNDVTDIKISGSNDCFYTVDVAGIIRCFSYPDLNEKWKSNAIDMSMDADTSVKRSRIVEIPDENLLLYFGMQGIYAISTEDGSTVWSDENEGVGFTKCFGVNEDKSVLASVASVPGLSSYTGGPAYMVKLMDTVTGEVIKTVRLPEEYDERYLYSIGNNMVISPDGKKLAFAVYFQYGEDVSLTGYHMCMMVADLESETISVIRDEEIVSSFFADYPAVVGMQFNDAQNAVNMMDYDVDVQSIRITRNYLDGSSEEIYTHPQNMFDKYITDSVDYASMDMSDDDSFVAFCDNVAYFRGSDTEKESYGAIEYEGIVLYHGYINDDHTSRLVITDDGRQQAVYTGPDGGTVVQNFCDINHMSDLDLSENFAWDYSSEFGHTIDPEAWGIAISDDDYKKVYILKPSIDPHIEKLDIEDRINKFSLNLQLLDDNHVAIYGTGKDSNDFVIDIYDLAEQKLKASYTIDSDTAYDMGLSKYEDLVFDVEKEIVYEISSIFTGADAWSLKDYSSKPVFDRYAIAVTSENVDGKGLLFAAITETEDYDYQNPTFSIMWTDADSEIREAFGPDDLCFGRQSNLDSPPLIKIGRCGYILAALFKSDMDLKTDSFLLCDSESGDTYVIKDQCPGTTERLIELGDKTPVFAASDDDGHVRVYDAKAEELLSDIDFTSSQETIRSIDFCLDDTALAIWTANAHLMLMDVASQEILYDEYTDIENKNLNDESEIHMSVSENTENKRLYFSFTCDQCIVVDSETFVKTAFIPLIEIYCPSANEIWLINGDDIGNCGEISGAYRYPSYTHDELIEWAKSIQ